MAKLKELKCDKCGGRMYKSRKSLGLVGLIVIAIGLVLTFSLSIVIGIIVIVIGLIIGSRIKYYWICKDCGYKFEREKNWFSLKG